MALPLGVMVPVPNMVGVKLVYTAPTADDSVSELSSTVVAARVNAVVPKSSLLNWPSVPIVGIAVPDPVNVKLGALVVFPALARVVPKLNVLVTLASALKPPVPEQVKLLTLAIDNTKVAAVGWANTMLPVPKAILRTPAPLDENIPVVKLYPAKSNVPAVKVVVAVAPSVKALPNVQVPPAPFNIILGVRVTPFVVIVLALVALNVSVPVLFQTVPATKDMLPDILGVPVPANVTVPALTVKSKHDRVPVNVTVYVPAWSKNTLSAAVGRPVPPAPPDVAAQLAELLLAAVPPTQYLFAMLRYSLGSVGRALTMANQSLNLSCLIDSIVSVDVASYSA
jgi:hypothetical protein